MQKIAYAVAFKLSCMRLESSSVVSSVNIEQWSKASGGTINSRYVMKIALLDNSYARRIMFVSSLNYRHMKKTL